MLTKAKPGRVQSIEILTMALLILYQVVRIVVFVNEYGAVEHDGGWALGVARSLAERGTYTSLTSTVIEPGVRTAFNIHDQFTVQDSEGREYFFVGNTTGPGVILPNALSLKLFGFGFWQSRLGGLIFFFLFLVITSAVLYWLQGLASVIILHLYLFFFPQLYIFLGYEVLGEMPSMVYILLSFVLFIKASQAKERVWLWFLASGLFMGLAVNTRLPALITFGGLAVVWLIMYWQKRITVKNALTVVAGFLLIVALWQLTIFISLMQVSDFSAYLHHLGGRFEFFERSVKGITPVAEGLELFLLKALILSEISHSHLGLSLILALTVGVGGFWLTRQLWADIDRRNMVILLGTAWLIYTIWFLSGPKNAWVRYYWYGLVLMVMFLGLIFGTVVHRLWSQPGPILALASLLLALLFAFSFSSQPQAISFFISPELIEVWHQRQLATRDTYLPWIIIPRAEQEQVAEFIRRLPPGTQIYYPEGHKTAELSFLTDHIFYDLRRRQRIGPRQDDLLIVGPAMISPWKKKQQERIDILETVHRECPAIVLETPNYIVCAVGTSALN